MGLLTKTMGSVAVAVALDGASGFLAVPSPIGMRGVVCQESWVKGGCQPSILGFQ